MKVNLDKKVPVALFAFNRPDFTRQVMEQIRFYAPPVVFLIQDGARKGVPGDISATLEVRKVLESVDWECQIYRVYADNNLGLLARFSSALSYVFSNVDRCIVLEDDVLPDQKFFEFVASALQDMEHDLRVGMVSGYSETSSKSTRISRRLSRKPKVWGWGTWSNRLAGYDPKRNEFHGVSSLSSFVQLRRKGFSVFEAVAWPRRMHLSQKLQTWDYQWAFHVLSNFGYSISPSSNLVVNLGFGNTSTNTTLLPPFINFDILVDDSWQLDSKVDESLVHDKLEFFRRLLKMATLEGISVVWKKVTKNF